MGNGQPNTASCGQKRRYPKAGVIDFSYYLIYDDGKLFWKNPTTVRAKAGQEAGWTKWNGYRIISLHKNILPAHHIVWHMFNGEFIEVGYDLDHIDGDRLNNRIENLRVSTRSQNLMNKSGYGKTSPYKGVYQHKSGNFYARFRDAYLGTYNTQEEAALVYNKHAGAYCSFAKLNDIFCNPEVSHEHS